MGTKGYIAAGNRFLRSLVGGDKSTQKRDIKRAIRMARTVKQEGLS